MQRILHYRLFSCLFMFSLLLSQSACLPIARQLMKDDRSQTRQASTPQNSFKVQYNTYASVYNPKSDFDNEMKEIYGLLLADDFESIDKIASTAREKKERMKGGYWKLDAVYMGLADIYADTPGVLVTEEIWNERIDRLKKWKEKSPNSITARVALGEAYVGYGWLARGGGTIDTVSPENLELFRQRLNVAMDELNDALKLGVHCPRLYREVMVIGMSTGMPNDQLEEVFETATNLEPNYIQYYLVKSDYLLPKWRGSQRSFVKFVTELPQALEDLGSDEGDIVYTIVVANRFREWPADRSSRIEGYSPDRFIKGFNDLDKKYKVDLKRLNQFAYVTAFTGQTPAAKMAFEQIGEDRDAEVWPKQVFDQMKKSVASQASIASAVK